MTAQPSANFRQFEPKGIGRLVQDEPGFGTKLGDGAAPVTVAARALVPRTDPHVAQVWDWCPPMIRATTKAIMITRPSMASTQ